MPLTTNRRTATLIGEVGVEEAEPLMCWLRATPNPTVRLDRCTHLHSAVLQTLLAARPRVCGTPSDPFLARWVTPLLAPPSEPDGGSTDRAAQVDRRG